MGCSIGLQVSLWFVEVFDVNDLIFDILGVPCWQENQASHRLSDLRTNKTVLDSIVFDIENESGCADF